MRLTRHAQIRAAQRGFGEDKLLLISLFGEEVSRNKDVVKLLLKDKTITRLKNSLDKCGNSILVSCSDYENIITVYHLWS